MYHYCYVGGNRLHLNYTVSILFGLLSTNIKSVATSRTFKRRLLDYDDNKTLSYDLPSSEGVS